MGLKRPRAVAVLAACGVVAISAGVALAAGKTHFVGKVGGNAKIHFDIKVHQGQATVYPIGWRHLKCAGKRFNGTMSQPLYANGRGKFSTGDQPQPTNGPVDGPPYLVTMKGKLTDDFKKASGTLQVKGGQPVISCNTGKLHWKAHAR
jgi:hypothetical protein